MSTKRYKRGRKSTTLDGIMADDASDEIVDDGTGRSHGAQEDASQPTPERTEPGAAEADASLSHTPVRFSHGELTQRVLEMTSGPSRLVEEPLDTGLWPTGQLSDTETSLFAAALRRHKRAA
jgi:hypothetical protein